MTNRWNELHAIVEDVPYVGDGKAVHRISTLMRNGQRTGMEDAIDDGDEGALREFRKRATSFVQWAIDGDRPQVTYG